MKNLNKNQKIAIISGIVFVLFLIGFSALSSLIQNGTISDFTQNARIQGTLAFVMFLPLLTAIFFAGKHFKSKNKKAGGNLIFVSKTLFIFGILQAVLSLLGVYES